MNDRPLTLLDARNLLGKYASDFDSAINQAVERIYDEGTWPGLITEVDVTDDVVDGILTLPEGYEVMLAAQITGLPVQIVPLSLEYSPAGPGSRDAGGVEGATGRVGGYQIVDMGQAMVGDAEDYQTLRHQYKLTFALESENILTGLLKRKFQYLTQDDDYVYPAHLTALKNALLAVNMEDEGDISRAQTYWDKCFESLNRATSQTRIGVSQSATFRIFGLGTTKPSGML